MDDSTASLLLLFVLLSLHGIVSLFNASLMNAHRVILRERSEDGDSTAKGILELTAGTLQLSMTVSLIHIITRFAIATVLTLLVIPPLTNGDISTALLAGILLVLIGASLTLILGDLVPEAIGSSYANTIARLAVRPMRMLILVLSPLTVLLLFISKFISSIFGSGQLVNRVTEEEIMTLVNAGHTGGAIDEEEKDMIYSVLHLDESSARELMTPRMDIIALDVTNTIKEALSAFVESGFSRIPIYEEGIDNVIGLLYAKDILSLLNDKNTLENKAIHDLIRPPYFVPETKRADALLKELQKRNVHLAIVVDEYGGTSGLVTIENLIEEIVGDIRDEYDIDEEEDYIEAGAGVYLIEASMDLDDINELLDCSIDTEDADTLGGYIFLTLGRVPVANEVIETDILSMTVQSIDGRRIRKVKVEKKMPQTENITDFQSQELKDEAS
jgi:putative hemolysin